LCRAARGGLSCDLNFHTLAGTRALNPADRDRRPAGGWVFPADVAAHRGQVSARSTRTDAAPRAAPSGSVVTQAVRIATTVLGRACLVTAPMPKMPPVATCVVETGRPNREAAITNPAVVRLAMNPWPALSGVIFLAMVSATLRAPMRPPAAMARPTSGRPMPGLNALAAMRSATILGVSLRPRAKQTAAAETKCNESSRRCADRPTTTPL